MFYYYFANLKSAIIHNRLFFTIINTKKTLSITKLLYRNGLISHYTMYSNNNNIYLNIVIRYIQNRNIMNNLTILSTPGHRRYWSIENIKKYVMHNYINTILIISSGYGIITQFEAIQLSSGGEILCIIN